jgi:hypothetical protein
VTAGRGLLALVLALALAGGWGCSRRASRGEIAAWNAEIRALEARQDSLNARAAELAAKDPRIQALPKGDIVLSIPTAFLRNVIARVFEDVANNATLSLGGIKVHVAKKLKKIVTIGEFVVDVDVQQVIGKLSPGQPGIAFGNNLISLSLPVEVNKGSGNAAIHFVWDGKNVADAVCGDMDVVQHVSGSIVPSKYVIAGRMTLAEKDNKVICTPYFPETKINIRIKPSKASWAAIDSLLESKHGTCGWVLDKVDVKSILTGVVQEKGFNVKLPLNKLKPFTLPGGAQDTLTIGERKIAIETKRNAVRIDPDAIWYGINVTLKSP